MKISGLLFQGIGRSDNDFGIQPADVVGTLERVTWTELLRDVKLPR